MKKLYIIWPSNGWDGSYYLINSDWYCMANHYCSNYWYAKWDLIEQRPERLEAWKDYLSDWYTLEIADESMKNILLEKNKVFGDTEYMNQYSKTNNL